MVLLALGHTVVHVVEFAKVLVKPESSSSPLKPRHRRLLSLFLSSSLPLADCFHQPILSPSAFAQFLSQPALPCLCAPLAPTSIASHCHNRSRADSHRHGPPRPPRHPHHGHLTSVDLPPSSPLHYVPCATVMLISSLILSFIHRTCWNVPSPLVHAAVFAIITGSRVHAVSTSTVESTELW